MMSNSQSEQDGGHYEYHGWIRRIDLALRTRYPHLLTRIFEISHNRYTITFSKDELDAHEIKNEFHNEIRFVTANVDVDNEVPTKYLREIEPLADDEIARGYAGMPMSLPQLGNLIAARFPNLPISGVRDGGTPMVITVDLSENISDDQKGALFDFCDGLDATVPWQLNVIPKLETPPAANDVSTPIAGAKAPTSISDPLMVWATRRRPYLPNYVRRDEAFWFDNIDNVYAGCMPVESFPGIEQNKSQCFMDLTVGDHINLRQALILYDTVYFSPPLAENHETFLKKQTISENDLLDLIGQGRMKIVSTQAEERLNLKFLEAASERNETAIIGRRSTAALLIADIVQMADEYRLAKPDVRREVAELAKLLAEPTKIPVNELLRLLMWPLEARRGALQPLLDRGSKGIAPIGLAPFLSKYIKRITGKDLELETLTVSERVHIGHALNATVFPNRYEPAGLDVLMNIMGDGLNFYRSFNTRIAASWAANEDRKAAGKLAMPALPLFEFEPDVPMKEFLESVRLSSTRDKGRALFGRLAELPDDQRIAEIGRLDAALRKRLKASDTMISFENLDTVASIGSLFLQAIYPPLAGLRTIGNQIRDKARIIPVIDRLVYEIEKDLFPVFGKNQDIDFLSRISRVATFKKNRIS